MTRSLSDLCFSFSVRQNILRIRTTSSNDGRRFPGLSGDGSESGLSPDGRRPGSNSTPKTVMICDDEPDILTICRIGLGSRYRVLTASSGAECLEKYSEFRRSGGSVDILLIDYRLGDALGTEIARKIRDMGGTRVILISAFDIDAKLKGPGTREVYRVGRQEASRPAITHRRNRATSRDW